MPQSFSFFDRHLEKHTLKKKESKIEVQTRQRTDLQIKLFPQNSPKKELCNENTRLKLIYGQTVKSGSCSCLTAKHHWSVSSAWTFFQILAWMCSFPSCILPFMFLFILNHNIQCILNSCFGLFFFAQLHRVLLPPAGDSSTRQSLAFFAQPDDDALITCCDGSNKYPPIRSRDHYMERYSVTYGKS